MYIYTQFAVLHLSCLNSVCVHSNSQLGPRLSSQIQRCRILFYDTNVSLWFETRTYVVLFVGKPIDVFLLNEFWTCGELSVVLMGLFHLVPSCCFSHNLSVKRAAVIWTFWNWTLQDAISISTVVSALEAMNGGKMRLKIDLPKVDFG